MRNPTTVGNTDTFCSFYYVTGADFPGCAVTYDIGRDSLILWIPHTDPKTILWNGRTPTPKQCLAASDVDDVRYIGALYDFLPIAVRPGSTVYCLHPDQVPQFQKSYGPVYIDTAKLVPAMDWARVIKTDYEVAMIRRANAVSVGRFHTQPLSMTVSPFLTRFHRAALTKPCSAA